MECLVTGLGGTTVVSPAAGGSSGGIGPASALSTKERTVPGPLKNRPPVTRNRVQVSTFIFLVLSIDISLKKKLFPFFKYTMSNFCDKFFS